MAPSDPNRTPEKPPARQPITRRRLAAVGAAGGSALLLAACGKSADPNDGRSDVQLLGYIREMQDEVAGAWKGDKPGPARGRTSDALLTSVFAAQARNLVKELDAALKKAGAKSTPEATFTANLDVSGGPEAYEAFLVGVTNSVVPDLGTNELRQLACKVAAAAGARLAALASSKGEPPAPHAFLLGELPPGFKGITP